MKPPVRPILRIVAILLACLLLTGCAGSVSPIWVQQNQDFQTSIVDGILLPHYVADPTVTPAAKQAVQSAVAEHEAAIQSWQTPPAH